MKIDWLWFAVGIAFALFGLPLLQGLFGKLRKPAAATTRTA